MTPTPLDEFKKLLPDDCDLDDEQLETMRDLVDLQADLIIDSYIKDKTNGII